MKRRQTTIAACWICLCGLLVDQIDALGQAGQSARIAVADFVQAGGGSEASGLGAGLQSMVTTDLARISALTIVERQRLNEVREEIKLSRSREADKATAIKFGKLAGATHIVTGTYTMFRAKLRLDARIISVEDGEIVKATSVEGEQDAFFELTKELTRALVFGIGIRPKPRERAAMAEVQTADIDALTSFGRGLQEIDEKDYAAAIAALQTAVTKDASFDLARVTLRDYERLVADTRATADAIRVREQLEREQEEAERKKRVETNRRLRHAANQRMAKQLFEETRSRDVKRRLAAWCMIKKSSHRIAGSEFAESRLEEHAARMFYQDARDHLPIAMMRCHNGYMDFLHYDEPNPLGPDRTRIEPFLSKLAERFGVPPEKSFRLGGVSKVINKLGRIEGDVSKLDADLSGQLRYLEDAFQAVSRYGRKQRHLRKLLHDISITQARKLRQTLDLDASTKIFLRAREYVRPDFAKGFENIADEIELNKLIRSLLDRYPNDARLQEGLRLWPYSVRSAKRLFEKSPKDFAEKTVALRQAHGPDHVYVATTSVNVEGGMWVGPMIDPTRTEALVFASEPKLKAGVATIRSMPASDFNLSFLLDWTPPKGAKRKPSKRRPSVSVLFGFEYPHRGFDKNVKWDDPVSSFALALEPTGIRLLHGELTEKERWKSSPKILASRRGASRQKVVRVQITKRGRELDVRWGQHRETITMKSSAFGQVAFLVDGQGKPGPQVAIRDVQYR